MTFTLPETIIQRGRNNNSRGRVFKFPDDLGVHGMLLIFKRYNYSSQSGPILTSDSITKTEIKDAIMLPLPANIQDTYNIRIQPTEQGISGAGVSEFASTLTGGSSFSQGAQNVNQRLMDAGSASGAAGAEGLREIANSISGSGSSNVNLNAIATGAAFLARRTLDRFGGTRNIDIGTGNTVNPKAALYFEGMTMKQHSFDWTLTPKNRIESETIKNIENAIKRNSLPSYTQFGEITRALLNYPCMVDMYFFGIDSDYFLKFKTCMIQTATFSYTPQGLAIMKGGKPAAVSVNLQMVESDIHTSEDYGNNERAFIPNPDE